MTRRAVAHGAHVASRILDVVEGLDLWCAADRMGEKDPRRSCPRHPPTMPALGTYTACHGIGASRTITAATLRVVCGMGSFGGP